MNRSGDNPNQNPRMALTQEELAVLMKCNRDAFWQRSLPLMAAMSISTHWLVKMQYLRPHPVRGSLYKSIVAGCIGWVIGKMSYRGECQRRVLEQLPNSQLAKTIRDRQVQGVMHQHQPQQAGEPLVIPPPRLDVDTTPLVTHGDYNNNDTNSNNNNIFENVNQVQSKGTTYDELRRRHHSNVATSQQQQHQQPQPVSPQPKVDYTQPQPQKRQRVNQFGDVVDE